MSNCNWYCYLPQMKENPNKTQIKLKNSDINSFDHAILKYCMDKDKLNKFIQSVSIVKEYKALPGAENDPNPSLPGLKWIALKPVERPCELGCGELVIDQKIESRLALTPTKHWKIRCANCQKYVHPDGKKLVTNSREAQKIYQAWLISQMPDRPTKTIEYENYTEITTKHSVIKKYR